MISEIPGGCLAVQIFSEQINELANQTGEKKLGWKLHYVHHKVGELLHVLCSVSKLRRIKNFKSLFKEKNEFKSGDAKPEVLRRASPTRALGDT